MAAIIQRSSQLHRLREVGLSGRKFAGNDPPEEDAAITNIESYSEVSRAFDGSEEGVGDIKATCPNIKSLDLSRSLIPTWLELSKITVELAQLESLTLHFNRFAELTPKSMPVEGAFAKLKELRMDESWVSWSDVLALSPSLPELESLQLGSNGIRHLGGKVNAPPVLLSKLRSLNLEGNLLEDWDDIWSSLAICPDLERLILSSNRIDKIPSTVATKRANVHQKLQHISLWDNSITSWNDIDNLNESVGGLQSLVLGGDHCVLMSSETSASPPQARLTAIARLASLQVFNGARVGAMERRDAELYYLSLVAKEEGIITEEDRNARHPRFEELCGLHGRPIVRTKVESSQEGTLRNKLMTLSVHLSSEPPTTSAPYGTRGADHSAESKQAVLLTTTPLRLLLPKLARLFQLKRGARSIESVWAVLSPSLDPLQETANILREEMRPATNVSKDAEERIIYQMDSLERDLEGYNFSSHDEIVVVYAKE